MYKSPRWNREKGKGLKTKEKKIKKQNVSS